MWMIGTADRPAVLAWPLDNPVGKPDGRISPRPRGFPQGLPTGFPDFTHIKPIFLTRPAGLALVIRRIFLENLLKILIIRQAPTTCLKLIS